MLSGGKIIFVNSKNFFYVQKNKININFKYRSTLKFKIKDDFDRVFNATIQVFFPISFLSINPIIS